METENYKNEEIEDVEIEEAEQTAGKVGMSAFNVVKKATDGVKVPLTLPDGTKTDEYLIVRGADCKAFQNKRARANRERLKLTKQQNIDPVKLENIRTKIDRELVAALVVDWSFDEECNEENVIAFFKNAPQIQTSVDMFAAERSNFFDMPPKS